jgi:hypothetical protein
MNRVLHVNPYTRAASPSQNKQERAKLGSLRGNQVAKHDAGLLTTFVLRAAVGRLQGYPEIGLPRWVRLPTFRRPSRARRPRRFWPRPRFSHHSWPDLHGGRGPRHVIRIRSTDGQSSHNSAREELPTNRKSGRRVWLSGCATTLPAIGQRDVPHCCKRAAKHH